MNEATLKRQLTLLTPTAEQLSRIEARVFAELQARGHAGEDPSLSLSAEWARVLREHPVSNTLLVAAASALVAISGGLGVAGVLATALA